MLLKPTLALTALLLVLPNSGFGADPTTIEIGGFNNGQPDPTVDPGTNNPGYIRIKTQPGFWVYPMFQVRLGPAQNGNDAQDRNAFISNWPFLEDLLPTQLAVVYADYIDPNHDGIPDIDVSGLPNLEVDQRTLETAFGFAVLPPVDTAVISRMQPIVPISGGAPDANGNWTLDWNCEPEIWNPYPSSPARILWGTYRSRGCDNNGSNCVDEAIALNFDEILHDTIRQQIVYRYPGKTDSEVTQLLRTFMGGPYLQARQRWTLELVVQIIGVKGNIATGATKPEIESAGIKDIQNGNLPDITLSPSDEVVFHFNPSGPGNGPDLAPPENTNDIPVTVAINGKAVFNICSGTSFTRAIWVDALGIFHTSKLEFAKPGHWSFTVPANCPPGLARVVQFVHPSGQAYPLLANPIFFMIQ